MEVTASDGTECRLTIPAGTLSESTNIKITAESSPHESMFTPLSNSFLLEPEGLEFDEPITIEITVPNALPSDQAPVILLTSADGSEMLLETQVDGQTLSASIEHFSSATAVAWTEDDLVDYWDLIIYSIDRYELLPIHVESLFHVYNAVYNNPDVFSTIDLSQWYDELRELTNDLILKGSLLCSSGNCNDGNECLILASKICMILYDDLADWALQEYDNCCAVGTIVIDQSPDNLSGAGWSLSGPRNETGSGDVTLIDRPTGVYTMTWIDVSGYVTPSSSTQVLNADGAISFSGSYTEGEAPLPRVDVRIAEFSCRAKVYVNEQPSHTAYNAMLDTGWYYVTNLIQKGENIFRFVVFCPYTCTRLHGVFEVRVDGEILISHEIMREAPYFASDTEFDETVTLTF